MEELFHELSPTEIKYGILALRDGDGTRRFFSNLPERFTINLRGENLFNRKLLPRSIWIGFTHMRKFNPFDVITIKKDKDVVYML